MKESDIIEKLEEGPENKELYASFLFIAIQYTIGTNKWKKMIQLVNATRPTNFHTEELYKQAIMELKCWTTSDEAFALAVTKNNLEVWIARLEDKKDRSIQPLFTRVHSRKGRNKSKKHRWSDEGIHYYNERFAQIEKAEEEHKEFYFDLIQSLQEPLPKQKKKQFLVKKNKRKANTTLPTMGGILQKAKKVTAV